MAASFDPPRNDQTDVVLHRLKPLGVAAVGSFAVITACYFSYRIPLTNPHAPIMSALLLAAEAFGLVSLVLHLFSVWTLVERRPTAPDPDVSADIFVTTWNEPTDMLRNTLRAAKKVRFARHVWLLDDGAREEMRALAETLGVKYVSRTDRSHAKAGNLNNALAYSDADFIAQFDCDHAPSPEFLERTLGYFRDPKVAFVQTPQDFYNIDSFQHRQNRQSTEFWHEQTLFYRIIQRGKDFWNAAFFCGSCAVIRRAALDDIGGFATGTVTEDIHTSLKVHKKGWKSVYHAQSLAFGVAPSNLDQYETQRLRWGRGAMQVWRKEGLIFSPGLTLAQRACYFTSIVTYFEGWQKAVLYFMPMAVLLTGAMPIVWTGQNFVSLFLMWVLSGMLVNETVGRGYTKTLWMEEYNCLRFFTFINATMALILPVKWRFQVTPKNLEAIGGLPLRQAPQALIVLLAAVALLVGSIRFLNHPYLPTGAYIANVVWTLINGIIAVRAIGFSLEKGRQRRAAHRFALPAPVAASIPGVGDGQVLIATDLSVGGMQLRLPQGVAAPKAVAGKIMLPDGPLAFSGRVVRATKRKRTGDSIAHIQFEWRNEGAADRLNACLFGNALQWAANDWLETDASDFSWRQIISWFSGRSAARAQEDWQACNLGGLAGPHVRCLVQKSRREQDTWRALSYEMPPSVNGLVVNIPALSLVRRRLRVAGAQTFVVGGGIVYVMVLKYGPEGVNLAPEPDASVLPATGARVA